MMSTAGHRKLWVCILTAGLAALQWGCGEKIDPVLGDFVPVDGGATYGEAIKPLLDRHCIGCHASYRSGPNRSGAPINVNYDTYEEAAASASAGNTRVQAGSMPPSGPLSRAERELFQQWVDDGAPE